MDYREKFYAQYVSKHTLHLYGALNMADIKKQFVVWDRYFGEFLPQNDEANILELGCGNGGLVHWLQNKGYVNATGIDVSQEQVASAKKIGIKNIIQGDLMYFLRDKHEKYDGIFLRDVIEHFKKEEVLEIMDLSYQAIKNDGVLIIQTPNSASIFGSRYRYADFTHELSFTEDSLRQILLVGGFSNLRFKETAPVARGVKSFIRTILWKILRKCLQIFLLIETGATERILTQNIIAVGHKKAQ